MKCNICGRESSEGITINLVTGKFMGIEQGITSRIEKYSNFLPLDLWFCVHCWRVYSAQRKESQLIEGIVGIAGGLLGLIMFASSPKEYGLCAALGGLGLIVGAVLTVGGIREKINPTDWSSRHIDPKKNTTDSVAGMLESLLPFAVTAQRGEGVHFWKYSNWKDWVDKVPNIKVYTSTSGYYRESASQKEQETVRAKVNELLDAGKTEQALLFCKHYKNLTPESAFCCNWQGIILERMGRQQEALMAYWKAMLIDPKNGEAPVNHQRLLAELEKPA